MIIREMLPRELDVVLTLFNYYCEDAAITEDKYDQDRARETVREYCIRPNLFFRIAVNGQRPVGLIGGFLSQDPVESQVTATIQFLYLIPEFSEINNYQNLVDEFVTWGEQFKVTQVRAIDIGNKLDRLRDVYDELGFTPIRISIMNKDIA
jgi:hypothetical protein